MAKSLAIEQTKGHFAHNYSSCKECGAATQGGGRPKPDSHCMWTDVVIVSLTCVRVL